MKSIFTGKVMETKWQTGMRITFNGDGNWHLHERYIAVCYPVGWSNFNAKEYNRVLSRPPIHEGEYDFLLTKDDVFNIDGAKVIVENVIFNSDNSITYHTNKIIKNDVLISKEEAESFTHLTKEPERPKGQIIYENFTGTKREHGLIEKLLSLFKLKKRG